MDANSRLLLCRCLASWAAKARTLGILTVFLPATQISISRTASCWRRYSGTRMIRAQLRRSNAYSRPAESYQSIASLWFGGWGRSIASRNNSRRSSRLLICATSVTQSVPGAVATGSQSSKESRCAICYPVATAPGTDLILTQNSSAADHFLRRRFGVFQRPHASIELHLVNGLRYFADARPGIEAHFQQMSSLQNRRGRFRFDFKFTRAGNEPFLGFRVVPLLAGNPFDVAAQRIRPCHAIQKIEFASPRQAPKRAVADFLAFLKILARLQMIAHQRHDLRAHVVTVERVDAQLVEKTQRRLDSRF